MSETRKPLIYVVEDDEEQLIIMRMLLSGAGYDVITQSDADKVIRDVQELNPDMILLDVMLPSRYGVDGFALCSDIRRLAGFDKKPIIIVSAIADGVGSQREKLCTQVGADDFLVKPFEPPVLLDCIKQRLAAS